MRAPPPAQAWCRSGGHWLRAQQLIYALGAAVAAFWAGTWFGIGDVTLLPAGLGLGAAWLAGRVLQAPPVQLIWDGSAWYLRPDGGEPQPGRPRPMLDLGTWLLVRFDLAEPSAGLGIRWLPLARGDTPAGWSALRVALHAA